MASRSIQPAPKADAPPTPTWVNHDGVAITHMSALNGTRYIFDDDVVDFDIHGGNWMAFDWMETGGTRAWNNPPSVDVDGNEYSAGLPHDEETNLGAFGRLWAYYNLKKLYKDVTPGYIIDVHGSHSILDHEAIPRITARWKQGSFSRHVGGSRIIRYHTVDVLFFPQAVKADLVGSFSDIRAQYDALQNGDSAGLTYLYAEMMKFDVPVLENEGGEEQEYTSYWYLTSDTFESEFIGLRGDHDVVLDVNLTDWLEEYVFDEDGNEQTLIQTTELTDITPYRITLINSKPQVDVMGLTIKNSSAFTGNEHYCMLELFGAGAGGVAFFKMPHKSDRLPRSVSFTITPSGGVADTLNIRNVSFEGTTTLNWKNLIRFDEIYNSLDALNSQINDVRTDLVKVANVVRKMGQNIQRLAENVENLNRNWNAMVAYQNKQAEDSDVFAGIISTTKWLGTFGKEGQPPNKALRSLMASGVEAGLLLIPTVGVYLSALSHLSTAGMEWTIGKYGTSYKDTWPYALLEVSTMIPMNLGFVSALTTGLQDLEDLSDFEIYAVEAMDGVEKVEFINTHSIKVESMATRMTHVWTKLLGLSVAEKIHPEDKIYVPAHSLIKMVGTNMVDHDFGAGVVRTLNRWTYIMSIGGVEYLKTAMGGLKDLFKGTIPSFFYDVIIDEYWNPADGKWYIDGEGARILAYFESNKLVEVTNDLVAVSRNLVYTVSPLLFTRAPSYDLFGKFNCHIASIALKNWWRDSEYPHWINLKSSLVISEKMRELRA
jgi:hypothetical protein